MPSTVPSALTGKTLFQLKGEAIEYRRRQQAIGRQISHLQALHEVARDYGCTSWEILAARMERVAVVPDRKIYLAGPLTQEERSGGAQAMREFVDRASQSAGQAPEASSQAPKGERLYFSWTGEFTYYPEVLAQAAAALPEPARRLVSEITAGWNYVIPHPFLVWLLDNGYAFTNHTQGGQAGWRWHDWSEYDSRPHPSFETCFIDLLASRKVWIRYRYGDLYGPIITPNS